MTLQTGTQAIKINILSDTSKKQKQSDNETWPVNRI